MKRRIDPHNTSFCSFQDTLFKRVNVLLYGRERRLRQRVTKTCNARSDTSMPMPHCSTSIQIRSLLSDSPLGGISLRYAPRWAMKYWRRPEGGRVPRARSRAPSLLQARSNWNQTTVRLIPVNIHVHVLCCQKPCFLSVNSTRDAVFLFAKLAIVDFASRCGKAAC